MTLSSQTPPSPLVINLFMLLTSRLHLSLEESRSHAPCQIVTYKSIQILSSNSLLLYNRTWCSLFLLRLSFDSLTKLAILRPKKENSFENSVKIRGNDDNSIKKRPIQIATTQILLLEPKNGKTLSERASLSLLSLLYRASLDACHHP